MLHQRQQSLLLPRQLPRLAAIKGAAMLRVIFYLIIIAALGFGFSWLADRPGELNVIFGGNHYSVPLITAAAGLVALVAAIMIIWWLVKSLIQSPTTLRRHLRARTRDRVYQSLSTGLIAAGAGDAEAARRMRSEERRVGTECR